MKLSKILNNINYKLIKGNININIKDISYNSKEVKENYLFICLIGIDTDGHNYIKEAIKNGAKCLIISKDIEISENITIIKVKDTRKELSNISANFFNNPQKKLTKIAITGTKGKTSISWMIKKILETNNEKVGIIGTLGTYINNKLYPHKNTTPESYQIHKLMNKMVKEKIKYLIIETSSQALKVGRINNINFEYGIFTNISNDHIGPREHPTYKDYVESKSKLFKQCQIGILNKDDKEYNKITKNSTCKIITYGKNNCDINIKNIKFQNENNFLGTEFTLTGKINETYKVSAPGLFSAYNATAAIILCNQLKINNNIIKKGLINFKVKGRCEIIDINNKFKVVIDFAHNELSIKSIIETMKKYDHNKIITIFGCGGGRSKEIRYSLGKTSAKYSDISIITTDNPRNDNINDINKDIIEGIKSQNGKYKIIEDREKAIIFALNNAKEKDIILLLGKGHEEYQEIKGIRHPFSEKEIINKYINKTQ